MRRLFVCVGLLLISSMAFCQVIYLGGGYNVSQGEYSSFNYVIQRYNETRDYLSSEMDEINLAHGMSFDFGYATPGFLGGFGLQYNRAKTSAVGTVNEVKMQRDLKLHMLHFPLELAYLHSLDGFAWAPGIGISFLFWKYLTRVGESSNIDDKEYYKAPADMGIHTKFFVKFIIGGVEDGGMGVVIEPFYMLGLIDSDMWDMNQQLNPETYDDDPEKTEPFTQFGIQIKLLYKGEG